jgi:hypothetical protein
MFRKGEKRSKASIIATVIIIAIIIVVMATGKVGIAADNDKLTLSSGLSKTEVYYKDITAIELRDTFSKVTRTFGVGSFKISSGSFKNTEFGAYKLYVFEAVDRYVVVRCGDAVIVFNDKTAQDTQSRYQDLLAKTGLS